MVVVVNCKFWFEKKSRFFVRVCMLSIERQKGLTTSHLHTKLDPFASELIIMYCGDSAL